MNIRGSAYRNVERLSSHHLGVTFWGAVPTSVVGLSFHPKPIVCQSFLIEFHAIAAAGLGSENGSCTNLNARIQTQSGKDYGCRP